MARRVMMAEASAASECDLGQQRDKVEAPRQCVEDIAKSGEPWCIY